MKQNESIMNKFPTYQEVVKETLQYGELMDDQAYSTNVELTFYNNSRAYSVDVSLDIDWIESSDGFSFELAPSTATYWNGEAMIELNLLNEENAELFQIVKDRAIPFINEQGTLENERIEKEEDRINGYI